MNLFTAATRLVVFSFVLVAGAITFAGPQASIRDKPQATAKPPQVIEKHNELSVSKQSQEIGPVNTAG